MTQTDEATRQFISSHLCDDVRLLALSSSKWAKEHGIDLTFALDQIAGWQTAREKLPSWAATPGIVFPPHLSMEQCSSEATARYKARVASRCADMALSAGVKAEECALADLTGGFGVDCTLMARCFASSTYVERQPSLCDIARTNFALMGLNTRVVTAEAGDALRQMDHMTLIFLDPARRDANGARTYSISDCTPDVGAMKQELLSRSRFVMVKLSPMLDWRKAGEELGWQWVSEVHIVSTGGECKELLFLLSAQATDGDRRLYCANDDEIFSLSITPGQTQLGYSPADDDLPAATPDMLTPGTYIYEPNASIMKSGCFREVERRFQLRQLEKNSHLFAGCHRVEHFPGRCFVLRDVFTMNKRELRRLLQQVDSANITARNFPLSVAQLRQRLKLADGGDNYLFATTLCSGAHILMLTGKA